MSVELRVVAQDAPAANKDVVTLLRGLLKRAREGEIQSLAVAYIAGTEVAWDYVCEEGEQMNLSCVCRQVDEMLRDEVFAEE